MACLSIRRSRLAFASLALVGGLLVGGCADSASGYPSLAPRPIEQLSLAEPATPPTPPSVADPAAVQRFAPMIARAQAADADFRRTLEQERATLVKGRGATVGSEEWSSAQVSLSRIETVREPVKKILADLDAAHIADPTPAEAGAAIAAAQAFDQVQRIDAAETEAVSAAWAP